MGMSIPIRVCIVTKYVYKHIIYTHTQCHAKKTCRGPYPITMKPWPTRKSNFLSWIDSLPNMSWCLKNLRICCIFKGDWWTSVMLEFLHKSRKSQAAKVKNGRRCRTITSQKVKQERLYLGLSGVTGMTCISFAQKNDWSEIPAADA